MVRIPYCHCHGPGSIPAQGTEILQASQHSIPLPPKKEGWAERPRVQPRKQVLLQRPNKDKKRQFTPGPALKRREALITHSYNGSSTAVYNSLV